MSGSEASLLCNDFVLNLSEDASEYSIGAQRFSGYGVEKEEKVVQGGACCQVSVRPYYGTSSSRGVLPAECQCKSRRLLLAEES